VEIPFSSLILFNGKSGAGKSSLIQAFIFVITGEGKKLFKYGTKTLQVILEFEKDDQKYKIIRKKGPESLELKINESSFEDDEAQARINIMFGENFIISSVIKQKGESSFLLSSNRDKMIFLESILFSKTDLEKKKNNIKDKQRIFKENHQKVVSQKEILQNLISSKSQTTFSQNIVQMTETTQEASSKIEEEEQFISTINSKKEELLSKINKKNALLIRLQETIKQKQDSIAKNQKIQDRVKELEEDLSNLCKNKSTLDQKNITKQLDKINTLLRILKLQKERDNVYKEYDTTKTTLLEIARQEHQNILKKLNNQSIETFDEQEYNLYTKQRELLLEIKKMTNRIDEIVFDPNEIKQLEKEKKEIEEKVKLVQDKIEKIKIFKTCLSCPHCKKYVRYIDKKLVKSTVEDDEDNIDSVESEKSVLEKDLDIINNKIKDLTSKNTLVLKYKEIINDLDSQITSKLSLNELRELISNLSQQKAIFEKESTLRNEYTEKKTEIERDILLLEKNKHKSISTLYNKYDELNKKIDNTVVDETEEELTDKIKMLCVEQKEIDLLIVRIDEIKQKIGRLQSQLQVIDNIDDEEARINDIEEELKRLDKHRQENDSVNLGDSYEKISLLKDRIKYLDFQKEFTKLNQDLEEKIIEELDFEKKIRMCGAILEGFDITESKMLSKFIDTINHNLAIHLDAFFSEPISVTVKAFKDGKKGETKPIIDIEIIYKGNEVDVSNLSGGEYDRLNLAFSVTFNCLSSSNILILDESLASINQELAGDIIIHLKEHCTDKVIWMTQHQAVTGMFDCVHEII
jgi:DNA repair exonuclease SbcCD ATPase subunit